MTAGAEPYERFLALHTRDEGLAWSAQPPFDDTVDRIRHAVAAAGNRIVVTGRADNFAHVRT